MKVKVKFNLTIEVLVETEKDMNDTSIMDLQLVAGNLGNGLYDTLGHKSTHEVLKSKINSDYTAIIQDVKSIKREIII